MSHADDHLSRDGLMNCAISVNEAIRDYTGRGWSIIPIRPGDKRPLVRWEELQHRRAAEEEARGWFRTWPDAGVGIVTGAISGLVVIDVDRRHGGDVGLEKLEQEHGRLPTTVECRTGGGGRHFYFAHPGGLIRNVVGLAPGVDLRADGGTSWRRPLCTRRACGTRGPRGGILEARRLRLCLTGCCNWPSTSRLAVATPSRTGASSSRTESRRESATTRSPP